MSDRGVVRRLAAVLVADAVGYSRLMAVDELATHNRFKADLAEILTPGVVDRGGRVVKTTGDGLIAEFASVIEALSCALEVQRRMAERNAGLQPDRRLAYRIGVNLGDIIVDGDDIYGDDVTTAVRLESLADPGGIAVSGNVVSYSRGKLDIAFDDLGDHRTKDDAEPVRVYRVCLPGANGAATADGSGPPAPPRPAVAATAGRISKLQAMAGFNRPAIAVLPFENLSRDPEQEHFCDGLTNDITTDLSKFSDLLVIAANSAFTYKGRHVKVQEVSRDLGVRYVLEGSVQRAGERVRVNAQLIDAATGHHLWAERFDRPIAEIFDLQDEIIHLIVTRVAVKVAAAERERAMRQRPDDLNAYEAFQRGIHLYSNETSEALRRSQESLELASRIDPSFARAWAAQSYNLMQGWLQGWYGPEALRSAEAYALRAIELDPADFFNHAYLGFYCLHTGKFDRAISAYERAMTLNRNDPVSMVDMAEALVSVGRHAEAAERIRQAMQRDPHVPDWYRWNLGWALYFLEDYDNAIRELAKTVNPHTHVWLLVAACHARAGGQAAAETALRRFLASEPTWTIERERRSVSFKNDGDLRHWLEGCRLAGLREA